MKKLLLTAGVVILGAWAITRWMGGNSNGLDGSDPGLVLNRIWIDQIAAQPRDTANAFATISRESVGAFWSGSQYKGGYELFNFTAVGGELRIVYPQTDQKEMVKARAWRCKEQHMDYCLELTGASRGVKRYHSLDGWEIGDSTAPGQLLERIASLVRASN